MTPELVGAAAAGLAAVIGALAAAISQRQRSQAEDLAALAGELRSTRRRLAAALFHIHELRSAMALAGIEPPPVPAELSPGQNRGDRC
jgi:hypothetical protein